MFWLQEIYVFIGYRLQPAQGVLLLLIHAVVGIINAVHRGKMCRVCRLALSRVWTSAWCGWEALSLKLALWL